MTTLHAFERYNDHVSIISQALANPTLIEVNESFFIIKPDTHQRKVIFYGDIKPVGPSSISFSSQIERIDIIDSNNVVATFDGIFQPYFKLRTSDKDAILGRNDELYGSPQSDRLSGYKGNDNIYGGDGWDSIEGDQGDDILFGESRDDQISGNSGDDVIYGGTGIDTLWGGADTDILVGGSRGDIIRGGEGKTIAKYLDFSDSTIGDLDDISRFSFRSGDKIDLSAILPGDEHFTYIGSRRFSDYRDENPQIENMVRIDRDNEYIKATDSKGGPKLVIDIEDLPGKFGIDDLIL